MKYKLIYTLCIATLFACNNPKSEKTTTANKAISDSTKSVPALPNSFYKRLEGTIAGKQVTVNLQKADNNIFGSYVYNSTWLGITNYNEVVKDSLSLTENDFYSYYFEENVKSPHLNLAWTGKGFDGRWINGDSTKSYPIKLEEKYPTGSFKFDVKALSDSLTALVGNPKSPKAKIEFIYLQPLATNAGGIWLDTELKKLLGIKQVKNSRETELKTLEDNYFKEYKKQIKDADTSFLQSMNYENTNRQGIVFNGNDYVVIESFSYDFSGGAHGNYGSSMSCFDVKKQKQLVLSDIVKIAPGTLQKLMETNLRKLYNIKPKESLNGVLFENFIKPNKNFYFNQYGLAFMYNPYEVASYAQGQIVVFIPFKDLTQYLVPEFKTRMNL